MPFKKGVSGNPGGRPKESREAKELARKHSALAMAKLAELIESDDERVAMMAATRMLDRAFGKPSQAVELDGDLRIRHEDALDQLD